MSSIAPLNSSANAGASPVEGVGQFALSGAYISVARCTAAAYFAWYALLISIAVARAPYNDFGRFLASGQAYLTGGDIYAWNETIPAELPSPIDGEIHKVDLWNMNPPHFHLLVLPVAFLSAPVAFLVWTAGGVACLTLAVRLIVLELDLKARPGARNVLLLGLLAGVTTAVTLVTGQVSWYLMLCVTLMWRHARREEWTKTGAWFGVLAAWKPFLLIFLPYLALKRQWQALAYAAGTAALSFAIGLALFGVESHRSWLACVDKAENWAWLHINAGLWGFLTRCGTANPLFVPVIELPADWLKPVWLVGSGLIGATTLVITVLDRSPLRLDRAFALLLVASFLICPLGWNYYWILALGPAAAVLFARHETECSSGQSTGTRCDQLLLGLATFGWFSPVLVTQLLAGALTTATLGSLYFWATLAFWSALAVDGWRSVGGWCHLARFCRSIRVDQFAPRASEEVAL